MRELSGLVCVTRRFQNPGLLYSRRKLKPCASRKINLHFPRTMCFARKNPLFPESADWTNTPTITEEKDWKRTVRDYAKVRLGEGSTSPCAFPETSAANAFLQWADLWRKERRNKRKHQYFPLEARLTKLTPSISLPFPRMENARK